MGLYHVYEKIMDIDLKMLLQIGSVLVAIVGAMAVARQQLKSLSEDFEMFRDAVNKNRRPFKLFR